MSSKIDFLIDRLLVVKELCEILQGLEKSGGVDLRSFAATRLRK